MQAGDKLSFGNYCWQVLGIQNNKAFIITEVPWPRQLKAVYVHHGDVNIGI